MGSQTKAEAYQRIQNETRSAWENIYLFDSKYTEKTDSLFATEEESNQDDFFDDWQPGRNRPLFHCFDRWSLFSPDNRLHLAIQEWRHYPLWLRENVDQWAEKFPDLADDYGDHNSGLERMYHWSHESVTQYLIDVAEAHGIDGGGDIYVAGVLCRELLKDRAARRKLWGSKFVIGDWPECFLHLQHSIADERMALRKGNAVIARLQSMLTRWRTEPAEAKEHRQSPPILNSPVEGSRDDQQSANAELTPEERFKMLKPCEQKAWGQLKHSERENTSFKIDREHYDWLKEEGEIENKPAFGTWRTCVGKARKALGKLKNGRGIAHKTRSIVGLNDIEGRRKSHDSSEY